jgi:glycogen debranching enzyme
MEDLVQAEDQFYILGTDARTGQRPSVLQRGDTFAVFDAHGDIGAFGAAEQGVYHEGTRYLSRLRLRLNGRRPLLLSARVKEDNELSSADLTNPDTFLGTGGPILARDLVHLFRAQFLCDGAWHERLRLWNYGRSVVRVALTFEYEADFADIFEVRGTPRVRRGALRPPQIGPRGVRLGYGGLDGIERAMHLTWSDTPAAITAVSTRFEYELPPREPVSLTFEVRCERDSRPVAPRSYEPALAEVLAGCEAARSEYAVIESSNERFNHWVRRAAADLRMLVARTPHGDYPYAGVPWFSTPFGRDGLITALQLLWVNPRLARGVLAYLAATQADAVDAVRDAEPGKILHETRSSEMARLGEVPFGQYYGSIDATPLFIILAGAYFTRTGDREFIAGLWPHIDRALEWIDRFGDRDGDGFVEYVRRSPTGLVQQGWKDSQDSVFHADGELAEAPIALCEVQAYVYDARRRAAGIAEALGHAARARRLRDEAERLRVRFEEQFWCEERSTYALALDGRKQPCRVRTSNAGHTLFGGIASEGRARRVAEGLVGDDMFSGWGIRTVSAAESRYNPMSYHNGSVWPHDNGLIAEGLSRYGFQDLIGPAFAGLFEASGHVEARLPELLCGFHRRAGEGPTLYPVACAPQAWAAGAVFQFIQASLRLSFDAARRVLSIDRPTLPSFLQHLELRNLDLPGGRIDLRFDSRPAGVAVTVLRQDSDLAVSVVR